METANRRFALGHHDAAAKRIKRFSNVETSDRRRSVRKDRNTDASLGRSFHAVSLNGLIYCTNILAQYLSSVFSLSDVTIHGTCTRTAYRIVRCIVIPVDWFQVFRTRSLKVSFRAKPRQECVEYGFETMRKVGLSITRIRCTRHSRDIALPYRVNYPRNT